MASGNPSLLNWATSKLTRNLSFMKTANAPVSAQVEDTISIFQGFLLHKLESTFWKTALTASASKMCKAVAGPRELSPRSSEHREAYIKRKHVVPLLSSWAFYVTR